MEKLVSRWVFSVLFLFCVCLGAVPASASDYQIGPGDVLSINVYDHPDLMTTARVDNEGSIIFPLAGKVDISGMTTAAASKAIARKLDGGYIVNPQVNVFVEEFRSKKVVVMGEVIRPGIYEMRGPTSLIELISQAGGLTRDAGQTATIRRSGRGEQAAEPTLTVNVAELLQAAGDAGKVDLRDGDTVTVAKASVVYVTGQVRKPAAYVLEPDSTVIKLITMAGGFTELAAQSKVRIIRKVDGQERVMEKVSLHETLKPNDVMVVPESFF